MSEEKMTNCPKCGKPILNGGHFTSHARFNIRCPWCQSTLMINIQPKIITEVIKIGNGNDMFDAAPPPEELPQKKIRIEGFYIPDN
jgi:DNA-directed RNA polymerase subunit RPC12/RpoP